MTDNPDHRYEGDISVLGQLKRGEGRIGILSLSGVNGGVDSAARASAFEELDLIKNVTVLVGISAGAGTTLYAAGGIISRGQRIYWEECTDPSFISLTPSRFLKGTAADVGFLADVFRGDIGSNPADTAALRNCPGDVYAGVTDYATGEGILIDMKTATPDPVAVVHASIAMPILYRKPVYVNGKRYFDGAVGIPFPAVEMIKRWNLTGLIVLTNHPKGLPPFRRMGLALERFGALFMPAPVRRAMIKREKLFRKGLEDLRNSEVPHLIFWVEKDMNPYSKNPEVIKASADRARAATVELLRQA